jgi:hypothetical protein
MLVLPCGVVTYSVHARPYFYFAERDKQEGRQAWEVTEVQVPRTVDSYARARNGFYC